MKEQNIIQTRLQMEDATVKVQQVKAIYLFSFYI